jgi:hypothetical protein
MRQYVDTHLNPKTQIQMDEMINKAVEFGFRHIAIVLNSSITKLQSQKKN